MTRYEDRRHAGRVLAGALEKFSGRDDVLVLALPRGGVPVGFEVARALGAPLDVFIVRKLGVPGYEELAMGAIASGGAQVLNEALIARLGIPRSAIAGVIGSEGRELARREEAYRGDRPPLDVAGKIVILVDDGLATGSTMRAAIEGLKTFGPARLVVGVPVAAAETCDAIASEVDEIICASTPESFMAVGSWYRDFGQTPDEEVYELLSQTESQPSAQP